MRNRHSERVKFIDRLRDWMGGTRPPPRSDDDGLAEGEDPYAEPVVLEIRDVFDLHSVPPRQVKAVVEEYLLEARARRFRYVRIIHGKGIGVQREMVRKILGRTPFVLGFHDAPPEVGGLGATIAELAIGDGLE